MACAYRRVVFGGLDEKGVLVPTFNSLYVAYYVPNVDIPTFTWTRMDQANRHWMEIFDAITDFIVVHDEAHNVLRVNRSLAEFIGVPPAELIGVNMRALAALANESPAHACPFCRTTVDGSDEYVHHVL